MKHKKNMHASLTTRRVFLIAAFFALVAISALSGSAPIAVASSWITNFVPLLLLSIAASLIISSGHVDISSGAVMSFLGMFLVFLFSLFKASLVNVVLFHMIVIASGIAIYTIIFAVVGSRVSSLITTLSVFFIAKGMSTLLQTCLQGVGLCRLHGPDFLTTTSGIIPSDYVLSIVDTPAISGGLALAIVSIAHFWRFHTYTGLEHVAVGLNTTSAAFARVSTRKVHFIAFSVAGTLVGLATLIRIHGQTHGGWSANTGWGEELLAIAVAVIGGTRINGGRFDPSSVALAALVIYAMRDVVTNDLKFPSEMASILFGIMMATIVWLDSRTQKEKSQ